MSVIELLRMIDWFCFWWLILCSAGNHVPIKQIPGDVVAMYMQDMKSKLEEVFLPFKRLCRTREVLFSCSISISFLIELILKTEWLYLKGSSLFVLDGNFGIGWW